MLMNSIFANKNPKFILMFNQETAGSRALYVLLLFVFATLVISTFIYSPAASANRPVMDESADIENAANTNAKDAPSSVDIMMQQEARHTGDVLQMPAKEMQPGETLQIILLDNPRRGMSMQKVQQEYGQPIAISDSVGEPPITRWTYQDRVVYFEHSTVIHVVAR